MSILSIPSSMFFSNDQNLDLVNGYLLNANLNSVTPNVHQSTIYE